MFTQADAEWLFLVTQAVILSTIFLSITVITGMAGQISLCQGAFAAIGGFTVFQLADRYDLSVLAGALIGAVHRRRSSAALLSLPVRRLGGIWVAIATLAFAYFFDAVMVKFSWVGGGETSLLQGTRVPRPVIGPWDFADDRAFLVLALDRPRHHRAGRHPASARARSGRPCKPCGAASWPPSRSASRWAEPG